MAANVGDPPATQSNEVTGRQFTHQDVVRSHEIGLQSGDVAIDEENWRATSRDELRLFNTLTRGHHKDIHPPVHQSTDFLALNLRILFGRSQHQRQPTRP